MLLEVLEKVYGRNKKGELSHHAIKFCQKHNLSLTTENSTQDMIVAFSMLSNKEKRELAIRLTMSLIEEKEEVAQKEVDLLSLRKMSYRQACGKYHPDNKESGDEGIFKFIQEVKMAFWDYEGKPRKEIRARDWAKEKHSKENPFFKV